MPVFDYECRTCHATFDVYHKGKEIVDDVICPSCNSREYKKLISAPAVSVGGSEPAPVRSSGGCCGGGACVIN